MDQKYFDQYLLFLQLNMKLNLQHTQFIISFVFRYISFNVLIFYIINPLKHIFSLDAPVDFKKMQQVNLVMGIILSIALISGLEILLKRFIQNKLYAWFLSLYLFMISIPMIYVISPLNTLFYFFKMSLRFRFDFDIKALELFKFLEIGIIVLGIVSLFFPQILKVFFKRQNLSNEKHSVKKIIVNTVLPNTIMIISIISLTLFSFFIYIFKDA
jgi:hypothetical protein